MQEPSIGRIVHYRLSPSQAFMNLDEIFYMGGSHILPAMIMRVRENMNVDLNVFVPSRTIFLVNVAFGEELGNWFWPPRV